MQCLVIFAAINCCMAVAEETAIVISFSGDVKVVLPPAGNTVACEPGMAIAAGTRIITGEESYVKVALDRAESNVIKIKEQSEVIIKLDGDERIELVNGQIYAFLRDLKKGEVFRVRAPNAVCAARGTGWVTTVRNFITNIRVFDGIVFVRGINKDGSVMEEKFKLPEGYEMSVKKNEKPGDKSAIPADILKEIAEEMGMNREALIRKLQDFEKVNAVREKHMERILERRDRKRDEKRSERQSSGGRKSLTR